MSDSEFSLNDLVWAKMKGFSPWPGIVSEPPAELRKAPKKNLASQCIFFFGSQNFAFIENVNIKPYLAFKSQFIKLCKTQPFQAALREIEDYIKDPDKFTSLIEAARGVSPSDPNEEFDKLRSTDSAGSDNEVSAANISSSSAISVAAATPKKATPGRKQKLEPKSTTPASASASAKKVVVPRANQLAVKRSAASAAAAALDTSIGGGGGDVGDSASPLTSSATKAKRPRVSSTARGTANHLNNSSSGGGDNNSGPLVSLADSNSTAGASYAVPASVSRRGVQNALLNRPSPLPIPDQPEIDMNQISQTLQSKNIKPSALRFGFLGLGLMGSGIVKNLINSGHKVVVWNRTDAKCRAFREAGAQVGDTPSDVVEMTDIIFSCVADPQAAKDMVFGNCGVLATSVIAGKGYVEMTSIDSETSTDIAEAFFQRGARYLEAQIQGSRSQAEEGTLIILAAGDRTLFDECQTCFEAIGKNSYFLGDVGNATKMNLILQMIAGVSLVGLAESLAVADRAGLQQKDVLEVLELTNMASPLILEKGQEMIKGEYTPNLPLMHMQKDLRLALTMSEAYEQSLPLTSIANEVFKHAKRLGYAGHDASSVYVRAKF